MQSRLQRREFRSRKAHDKSLLSATETIVARRTMRRRPAKFDKCQARPGEARIILSRLFALSGSMLLPWKKQTPSQSLWQLWLYKIRPGRQFPLTALYAVNGWLNLHLLKVLRKIGANLSDTIFLHLSISAKAIGDLKKLWE